MEAAFQDAPELAQALAADPGVTKLGEHGGKREQGSDATLTDRGVPYLVRRLKRDAPVAVEAGKRAQERTVGAAVSTTGEVLPAHRPPEDETRQIAGLPQPARASRSGVSVRTQRTLDSLARGAPELPGTNADKRRAVETALRARPGDSDRAIAEHVGVSNRFVTSMRAELSVNRSQMAAPVRTVTRNGTTYQQNTANIGKASRACPGR